MLFGYSFSGIKSILYLGLLILTGFLLVSPCFFKWLFFGVIIQSSSDGESKTPKFGELVSMFLNG